MALYPNGRYMTLSPGRHFGPAPGLDVYARDRGDRQNVFTAPTWDKVLGGAPSGYGVTGFIIPLKAGGITSRAADHIFVTGSATGVLGLPGEASAAISATTNAPTGELIVSGQGGASLYFSTSAPALTASLPGEGGASFSVSPVPLVLGAIASLGASTAFSVAVAPANRLPVNDASPLREASAALTVTSALTPYAVGIMEGSTVDTAGMTPASVAQAVWDAALSQFQASGSTGEALAGAGAAGNPWLADLSGYSASQAGGIIKIIQRLLQNKQTTDPITGVMTVFADDGVTPLFQADLSEDVAGTTPYRGRGAERRDRLQ